MTAELAAIQKLAQRLAVEIANKELAEARLAAQTAEITQLRGDIEKLAAAVKPPAKKKPPAKRASR